MNVKKRNWGCVFYPESLPQDWIEQLKQSGLQFAVSPLHDKDINDEVSGEIKKPHYHVILCYDGPTTYSNVKSLCDRFNQPIPQPLEQVRGYYRYFTHEDNPEKYQYDKSEIRCFNGFDISDFVQLTVSETQKIIRELLVFIVKGDLYEYSDLMDLLLDFDDTQYFTVASTHTLFFVNYLRSRRFKRELLAERENCDTVNCDPDSSLPNNSGK